MFDVCKAAGLGVGEQILWENFYEFPVYIFIINPTKEKSEPILEVPFFKTLWWVRKLEGRQFSENIFCVC